MGEIGSGRNVPKSRVQHIPPPRKRIHVMTCLDRATVVQEDILLGKQSAMLR